MPALTPPQQALLQTARRAVLGTIGSDGRPRLVPICFAAEPTVPDRPPVIWTPLDEKPKASSDVRDLARVRDILARPAVTILVDRWDEDWTRLAWLRLMGTADLVAPDGPDADAHAKALALLRVRYSQYADHALQALPFIRIRIDRVVGWTATGGMTAS